MGNICGIYGKNQRFLLYDSLSKCQKIWHFVAKLCKNETFLSQNETFLSQFCGKSGHRGYFFIEDERNSARRAGIGGIFFPKGNPSWPRRGRAGGPKGCA